MTAPPNTRLDATAPVPADSGALGAASSPTRAQGAFFLPQAPQRIVLTIEDVDAPPVVGDHVILQALTAGVAVDAVDTTTHTTSTLSTRMTQRNIRYSWHPVAESASAQPAVPSDPARGSSSRNQQQDVAPAARFGHTAIVYGDAMILFGGREHNQFYNDLWSYDLVAHYWRPLLTTGDVSGGEPIPTPQPRAGHTATLVRGHTMFVIGGCTGVLNTACVGDVWAIELTNNVWRRVEPTHPPTSGAAHYGYTSDNQPHGVFVSAIAAPPPMGVPVGRRAQTLPPRKGHTTVNVDDAWLLVFGGSCGVAGADDNWIWRLECACGTWSILPTTGAAPSPRMYHVAELTERNTMLLFGGKARSFEFCQDLWELVLSKDAEGNLAQGMWRQIDVAGPVVPSARFCCSSIYHNGVLCVFLGGSQCYHEDSYEFDVSTRQWRRLPESSAFNLQPCTRPTTVRHNNTITMFGGCKPDNVCTNTVVEMELETPTLKEFCREWVRQHATSTAALTSPLTPDSSRPFVAFHREFKGHQGRWNSTTADGDMHSPLSPQHTGVATLGRRASDGFDAFEVFSQRLNSMLATERQSNRLEAVGMESGGMMDAILQHQLPESLQHYLTADHNDDGYH